MKLDLEHLGSSPEEIHLVLERSENPSAFDEMKLDRALQADFTAYSISDGSYRFEGTLQGSQLLTCVRTMELFSQPFVIDMAFEVTVDSSLREQVLEDEDEEQFVFRIPVLQKSVDIIECVRQLVVLQEPMNPVKDPSREFSWQDPSAGSNEPKGEDPRWEKLKEWKQKLDNHQ